MSSTVPLPVVQAASVPEVDSLGGRLGRSHGADQGLGEHAWPVYLRHVCELLWPAPSVVDLADRRSAGTAAQVPGGRQRDFLLIPGVRRVPIMVPAPRRIAAAAVRQYSSPRSPVAWLMARAVSTALASGLAAPLLRSRVRVQTPAGADSIEDYLGGAVGCDVWISMFLGPPRANRKPVLQVLSADGQPVGFAKVGVDPLTRDLVRAECASLTRLSRAGLSGITVPPVLHFGEWRGLSVLLVAALPAWQRRHPVPASVLSAAMAELAGVSGLERESLVNGPYLTHLRERLVKADEGPERAALQAIIDAVAERVGHTVFNYGAWHGDWAPWNMTSAGRRLMVWDWERFATGVPLGFDALHHWLQTEVGPKRRDPFVAACACPDRAPQLLAPFRIPATQARLTALLYLTELATRYLIDHQAEAGARSGAVGTWLIPALATHTARL